MSTYYDFDDFLTIIKFLDREDIIETAHNKHKRLDKASSLNKIDGALALQDKIQGLLYWIQTEKRPPTLSETEFAKFRPICERLITKGQMEAEALHVFDEE